MLTALLLAAPVAAVETAGEHPLLSTGMAIDGVQLAGHRHGAAAIQALGARLPQVAATYHLDSARLRHHFERDPSLHVDPQGRLFHVCAGAAIDAETAETSATGTALATPVALADTFTLHSRPGASKRIYLDFDGHVTSGTAWNTNYNGGADITHPAYDIDGNASSFSDTELERIQYIWQRVSEDYAPFDVDVTTEDPGVEALRRTIGGSDEEYGIRCVITTNTFYAAAGGVAYLTSFSWTSDTPAFVFENSLANGHEKYTAEAIAHEVGHTVGLYHDGLTDGTEYYSGHGSGDTGWAPIMGVGYDRSLTQFSAGEYSDANNTEDDLTIITTNNGFGYRSDDHGDDAASATVIDTSAGTIDIEGVIEQEDDVDVFTFAAGAGPLSIDVTGDDRSSNLDILVELRDSEGVLIASSNPELPLDAGLDLVLDGGSYQLLIDGSGYGSPPTSGYTDYASIGSYHISGTVNIGNNPPYAVASADVTSGPAPLEVVFTGSDSYDLDGSVVLYSWDFDDGASASTADTTHTFSEPGSYEVQLTVGDDEAASGSTTITITVNPTLSIEYDGSTITPEVVLFDGSTGDHSLSFEAADTALRIVGDGRRALDLGSIEIGPDTVLEFDFTSSVQGDFHGIGFDDDDSLSEDRIFSLHGTSIWGLLAYHSYSNWAPATHHYRIPVGDFYTGTQRYLVLINDHDTATPSAESLFANLVIHDAGDTPIAQADTYIVAVDGILNVSAADGLLTNDRDPEGQALSASLSSNPDHGLLSLLSDGSFTYTPDSGYRGADSFAYLARDSYNSTAAITVSITVAGPQHRRISIGSGDTAFDISQPVDATPTETSQGVFEGLEQSDDHVLTPVDSGDG